ncbi:hypothetical protein G6F65_017927 [Rhizopus arrhizus]|nr:hypothetical protein G6F65_017927 [Rhizopus arrhizus]
MLLLISSFTFGVAMLGMQAGRKQQVITWLGITFLVGAGFIVMELYEFSVLLAEGAGPSTSAYLSAYFTLVGTHGLHVSFGLIWILVLMHQVHRFGLDGIVTRRLSCLSMFWHFLDLVWICVFTFVYLREFPEELHRRLPAVAGTHAGVIRRRHDGPGAAREPVAGPGGAVHRAVAGAAGVFPAPGRVPHAARQHRRLHLHGAADRHHRGGFAMSVDQAKSRP